jgi:hypothetical protein
MTGIVHRAQGWRWIGAGAGSVRTPRLWNALLSQALGRHLDLSVAHENVSLSPALKPPRRRTDRSGDS